MYTITFLALVMCGCNTTHAVPNGYYDYDEDKVIAAVEQLPFNPALPDFIPIHMVSVVSDVYKENEAEVMDLSFYTTENDLLTIKFTEADDFPTSWVDQEKLPITDQIDGIYEDNHFSKKLSWQKGDITYVMTYRANVSTELNNEQRVTRQQLVEVARSFHS
ncbi:hypothetical protein [Halobacillus litoralis]|uniref:DUF4367 domain-containing protein n=1 Tax=Halobacillus litoralis TaxID=45668 RepID=A0A410MAT5_9BACI|nr:hypothetical protein [Halobacillus litoralis]QAS51790.1 hypothetical protein HLI_05850 [Halobacillus litoralis]